MLRELGAFERAAIVSNDYAPFNVVIVIRMENPPTPDALRSALDSIQLDYPLLRAKINEKDKRLWFQEDKNAPPIPLKVLDWGNQDVWESVVVHEMASSFPKSHPPLIRAAYLFSNNRGDLILSAHHALIDGSAGVYLVEQLLRHCSGEEFSEQASALTHIVIPELPPSHQGGKKFLHLGRFVLSQIGNELAYRLSNMGKRIPKVHHGGSGKITTITLSPELTDRIVRKSRLERVTLNSVLNATQLLAVNKILYAGKPVAMQTFSFADLRPYLFPPVPPETLGGWVTLFRVLVNVNEEIDFWQLAKTLHHEINISLKRGDKYNAFLTSESLLRMMTKMNAARFGSSAINYSGVIPLKPNYGEIQVRAIHGFVSAYDLAPELSAQARIFNDQIIWDFIYLDTDMDDHTAAMLVDEIKSILKNATA